MGAGGVRVALRNARRGGAGAKKEEEKDEEREREGEGGREKEETEKERERETETERVSPPCDRHTHTNTHLPIRPPIRPLFQARIHVLEQDVRKSTADDPNPAVSAGFDMVCALNYSYSIFKERSDLVVYVTIG